MVIYTSADRNAPISSVEMTLIDQTSLSDFRIQLDNMNESTEHYL